MSAGIIAASEVRYVTVEEFLVGSGNWQFPPNVYSVQAELVDSGSGGAGTNAIGSTGVAGPGCNYGKSTVAGTPGEQVPYLVAPPRAGAVNSPVFTASTPSNFGPLTTANASVKTPGGATPGTGQGGTGGGPFGGVGGARGNPPVAGTNPGGAGGSRQSGVNQSGASSGGGAIKLTYLKPI